MTIQPIPRSKRVWRALRLRHVTASEIAPFFGMGAAYQSSPFATFHIKSGTIPEPEFESERMEAGTFLEPSIAKWAAKREGWKIRKGVFAIDDHVRGASATLDYVIDASPELEAKGFFGPGSLEVKNVDKWEFQKKWEGGEPPPHIALQHQQQLGCTGWLWGAIAVCAGGNDLEVIYYHARPPIIEAIRSTIGDFWYRVDNRVPYPVDHFASTEQALRALYKPTDETVLDLTGDLRETELAIRFEDLGVKIREAEKERSGIQAQFRLLLGKHKLASGAGFKISRSVGENTPDRVAAPGEIIKGRKGQDRLTVTVRRAEAEAALMARDEADTAARDRAANDAHLHGAGEDAQVAA